MKFLLLLMTLFLIGCASEKNLVGIPPSSDFTLAPDEAVIMVGIPDYIEVLFQSGTINNEGTPNESFSPDNFDRFGAKGHAESGYLIRKVKAMTGDRGFVLCCVNIKSGVGWLYPRQYTKAMVLDIKPGVIQYYGDLDFSAYGGSAGSLTKFDIDKASLFFKKAYPNVSLPVIKGQAKWIMNTHKY